jgi:hypothetical protein
LHAAGGVDHEHVDIGGRRGEHAFVVARQQRAVEAEREADASGGRATERLDEAVVATAAAERVLRRVQGAALELERGVAVVVETAHELGIDGERDAERREPGLDGSEVCRRLGAVELGDLRCSGDERSILGRFESSTRSGFFCSVTWLASLSSARLASK